MTLDTSFPQRGPDLPDVVAVMRPHCGPMTDPEGLQALEEGYAWPVDLEGSLIFFSGVDEHVDGNGWRILTLVAGEGVFECGAQRIPLTEGQTLLFDDRIEHGFHVDDPLMECYAVTAAVGPSCVPWPEAIQALREALSPYAVKAQAALASAAEEPVSEVKRRRRRTP